MSWTRVTRRQPCPICNHPDWCVFTPNLHLVMCMRIESKWPTKSGGFMHTLGNEHAPSIFTSAAKARHPVVSIDCSKLLSGWRALPEMCLLESFAATLNVSQASLRALGCVYAVEHRAFAFPMHDAQRRVIGIRLRNDLGRKWAVTGSKQGLFLSGGVESRHAGRLANSLHGANSDSVLESKETETRNSGSSVPPAQTLIVEGPTDAAAALDLGFNVIGRPACLGCEDMIVELARKHGAGTMLIIADSDGPGQRGAESLRKKLRGAKIVTLPCKDLREFKSRGGTKEILNAVIGSVV